MAYKSNEEVASWIEKAKEAILNSSLTSSVYVGADSIRYKKKGKWYAKYTTVIVIHKDSRHGCQIFYNSEEQMDFGNLRQRLLTEVNYAITATLEILDTLGERHLEVHLDLNPNPKHKSSVAVKEAIGWVRGTIGIDPLVKPHGWASTHAADHAVRYFH